MTITGIYYPLDIKVNNDHHGDLLPLGHYKVNNDHHGDLLPLGHLGCPSRGSTIPWVKSNMGEPRPPEDI